MTNNKLFLWLITWRIVRTSDLIKKARAHWIYMHVRAFMHLCKICAWKCPWYANDSKCIVAYYDIWEVNSALIILYFYFLYKSSSTNILRIFYRKNERRKVIDKIREKRKMTLQRWLKWWQKRILEQWTRCSEWLSSSHVFQIILCNNL